MARCSLCVLKVPLNTDQPTVIVMSMSLSVTSQVIQMCYFVVFLLIIIIAYGVLLQSVWFPNKEFEWESVREIFIKPYFNLYGEVYADEVWRKFVLISHF